MLQEEPARRPAYIAIHARDSSGRVLYVSSGVRQALGYTPAELMAKQAVDFIADSHDDYMLAYDEKDTEETVVADNGADDANAYIMYVNVKAADGTAVLQRMTTFKCDNCVLVVAQMYPEVPFTSKHELEVQMLDGARRRVNVTRQKEAQLARRKQHASARNHRVPVCYSRGKQTKAALVLENPGVADRCAVGPRTVFVTGSISHIIEADPGDVMHYPFLKLVAPEDVLHVSRFFDHLAATTDVQFETFSLTQHPRIIEGDVPVADADNPRVVVECLGAAVEDGVVLMLRKLRIVPAPKRDSVGNYIHARVLEIDNEYGALSLAELISSDPKTSDAPDAWSRLC
ncbi:hypothetical protein H4R19_000292 [Coemansia spiralis]|nr:hypothetical protein H4R19_000292 [Coemansia spiralis]